MGSRTGRRVRCRLARRRRRGTFSAIRPRAASRQPSKSSGSDRVTTRIILPGTGRVPATHSGGVEDRQRYACGSPTTSCAGPPPRSGERMSASREHFHFALVFGATIGRSSARSASTAGRQSSAMMKAELGDQETVRRAISAKCRRRQQRLVRMPLTAFTPRPGTRRHLARRG